MKQLKKIDQLFRANQRRTTVYNLVKNEYVSLLDLVKHFPDISITTLRGICYDMENNGYLTSINGFDRITRKNYKKYKATAKHFVEKSYDKIADEFYRSTMAQRNENMKGKYDQLIASNPNLRIIRKIDEPLPADWWGKKKEHFTGIGSSFAIDG